MQDNKNYVDTMDNAAMFFSKGMHDCAAELLNGEGYTARLNIDDKQCWEIVRIDKESKWVIFDIFPMVTCLPEAIPQTSEYITAVNSNIKLCNFRIDSNGAIYVHCEQHFDDEAVNVSVFRKMETSSIEIIDVFYTPICKLANCRLLTGDEADIGIVILKHDEQLDDRIEAIKAKLNSTIDYIKHKEEGKLSNEDSDDDFDEAEAFDLGDDLEAFLRDDDPLMDEVDEYNRNCDGDSSDNSSNDSLFSKWLDKKKKALNDKLKEENDSYNDTNKVGLEGSSLFDVLIGLPDEDANKLCESDSYEAPSEEITSQDVGDNEASGEESKD